VILVSKKDEKKRNKNAQMEGVLMKKSKYVDITVHEQC